MVQIRKFCIHAEIFKGYDKIIIYLFKTTTKKEFKC